MARLFGMSDLPRIQFPHPIAGTGDENIGQVAEGVVDAILDRLAQ